MPVMKELVITSLCVLLTSSRNSPNIILILADDLGWNEVSWHNPRIKTPHMEVNIFTEPKEESRTTPTGIGKGGG